MSSNTIKNSNNASHVSSSCYDVPKGVDKVLWGALLEAESALIVAHERVDSSYPKTRDALRQVTFRVNTIRACISQDASYRQTGPK